MGYILIKNSYFSYRNSQIFSIFPRVNFSLHFYSANKMVNSLLTDNSFPEQFKSFAYFDVNTAGDLKNGELGNFLFIGANIASEMMFSTKIIP